MIHRHWIAFGVCILGLGVGYWALAGAPPDTLPSDVFTRLVSEDVKYIRTTLTKSKLDKKTGRKVKAAALMIAQYAQANMNNSNAKEMASLRDKAIEVIKAVDDDKIDEARKLASALSPKPMVDPAAKVEKIPLHPHLDFEFLMRQFSGERIGGFALEAQLEELVDVKGALEGEKQQKALDLAYKITMLGNLAHSYPKEDEPKGKTKKAWEMLSTQMRAQAVALADTIRMGKEVGVAANALTVNCTKCHDVFR
jgi:hypothetical protein